MNYSEFIQSQKILESPVYVWPLWYRRWSIRKFKSDYYYNLEICKTDTTEKEGWLLAFSIKKPLRETLNDLFDDITICEECPDVERLTN